MDFSEINYNEGNEKYFLKIKCDQSQDEFKIFGRPCELSAFSFVPENRLYESAERSIYNYKQAKKGDDNELTYDQLFNIDYNYNNKVHRCDRKHAKLLGLNVWNEEVQKVTPSRFSSEIGKTIINLQSKDPIKVTYEAGLDPPDRKHTKIDKKAEFYNRNGINDLNRQRGVL